ncbi:MAG: hypothetical protein Q9188_006100 [Gyalolechia gomerana]
MTASTTTLTPFKYSAQYKIPIPVPKFIRGSDSRAIWLCPEDFMIMAMMSLLGKSAADIAHVLQYSQDLVPAHDTSSWGKPCHRCHITEQDVSAGITKLRGTEVHEFLLSKQADHDCTEELRQRYMKCWKRASKEGLNNEARIRYWFGKDAILGNTQLDAGEIERDDDTLDVNQIVCTNWALQKSCIPLNLDAQSRSGPDRLKEDVECQPVRCALTCMKDPADSVFHLHIGELIFRSSPLAQPLIFVDQDLARKTWGHARIEVPTMRPPGKAYYVLPGEGCHLLKFGGKLLVIEICNVCRDDEQYIISGPEGLPHHYVKHCQQEGERSQGVTHYTPASRPKRAKGHEPWLAFDKKPARTFDSVALPEGTRERIETDLNQ